MAMSKVLDGWRVRGLKISDPQVTMDFKITRVDHLDDFEVLPWKAPHGKIIGPMAP